MINHLFLMIIGSKSDDPESPAYCPTMFRECDRRKYEQQLQRYEALQRRRGLREEVNQAVEQPGEVAEQTDPQPQGRFIPLEEYEALQGKYEALSKDYQQRVASKEETNLALSRGFPDENDMKKDEVTVFYTGLPCLQVFVALLKFIVNKTPENPLSKLTHFQCFLLSMMKLRLNLSNYDLGFRFNIHETTVSRIIVKWIQLIDTRLSPLIKWPSQEELQKTMPWSFRLSYGLKVTSIIDCFELYIEKPTDYMARAATWSTYKHHNTIKYLISITPQGTVNYLSKGYGGRASDKFITENCGYLGKLHTGDVVLADRGFTVQESIAYRSATLNIPAFTHGKAQLSALEVEETRKIARVRIHVERVIGSLRQRFQILDATTPLPKEYIKSKNDGPIFLDSIVRCCCALHNVCDVIITD